MPTDEKPSRNEDEYFARMDADLVKAKRAELDSERAKRERESHHGRCPRCGGKLVEKERDHVKVDECADCGGIWLDKGELELLRGSSGRKGRFFG